ncbi:hypothetical protein C2845_PM18G02920 [Panicum miliaceum]|uniref:Uncharacterized protein n=1 Tax=Panicum miliaceum TaxID=4540 RepID=A0A3L6PIN8_PANMI|nr:hypothetical protein C2845_PM18G02920 [Panicum miliaceum]
MVVYYIVHYLKVHAALMDLTQIAACHPEFPQHFTIYTALLAPMHINMPEHEM